MKSPTICLVNQSTMPLGVDLTKLAPALQSYINNYVGVLWNFSCNVVTAPKAGAGEWPLLFLDTPDQPDALGDHSLLQTPVGKVFVGPTISADDSLSSVTSHELAEMMADPYTNTCIQMFSNNNFWAFEICDAVEETEFPVDGFQMSNFVYPAWFLAGNKMGGGTAQYDYMKKCTAPGQLLPGGYISIFTNGKWSQEFGSDAAKSKHEMQNHPRVIKRHIRNDGG